MSSIKDRFVLDTLEREGQRMLRNQGIAIGLAYKSHSGRLLHDRKIRVSGTGAGDARMEFDHPIYERFLDLKTAQWKGRKTDRRIHNRFVYGTYSAIERELMHGFTEEVAERIAAHALDLQKSE